MIGECQHCHKSFDYPYPSAHRKFCEKACQTAANRQPFETRFWGKVDKSTDCWLWTAHLNENGYGTFELDEKTVKAHRVSFEAEFGPIPAGMLIGHSCDRNYASGDITYRRCVRPSHLFVCTHLENMRDAMAKNRFRYGGGSPRAKLTDAQVLTIRKRAADGTSYVALAREFGVHKSYVSRIVHYKKRAR